ncbi:MAG: hypothetical protein KF819_14760 [Labilithrix sp.]|nr:hypothetical protein [Labilithrix sp.]
MSLRDLLLVYGVVGLGCGLAVWRRATDRGLGAVLSALATVPLWPLWAPFALMPSPLAKHAKESDAIVARVEKALAEAVDAAAETPMSEIFSRSVAGRIATQVRAVAARLRELEALSAQTHFDRGASAQRLADLEQRGAPERAIATARLQHDSLLRLADLRAADAQALEELADLLDALRTQLVLARYAGASDDGASAIVGEVWARLEGLGAALDQAPHAP